MTQLKEYTPQGLTEPVALISDNLPEYVLKVIDNNWSKTSSGLGDHFGWDSFLQSSTNGD
tara:strand:+ start:297 stop:476 length:180 start_codon:yes stop_codon:yes gene_type:complete